MLTGLTWAAVFYGLLRALQDCRELWRSGASPRERIDADPAPSPSTPRTWTDLDGRRYCVGNPPKAETGHQWYRIGDNRYVEVMEPDAVRYGKMTRPIFATSDDAAIRALIAQCGGRLDDDDQHRRSEA